MTGRLDRIEAERLARAFHETYERLAPGFGYATRRESAVPWEDVPEANRALMVAVVSDVCAALVEVAKAAQEWDADLSDYCDGPIRDRLRAALARLEERRALDTALVAFYKSDPVGCARLCDDVLDKRGALLGRIRELAATGGQAGRALETAEAENKKLREEVEVQAVLAVTRDTSRREWIQRAHAAEAQVAALTEERDEARRRLAQSWDETVANDKARAIRAELRAEAAEAALAETRRALEEFVDYYEEQDPFPTSDEHPLYNARRALAATGGGTTPDCSCGHSAEQHPAVWSIAGDATTFCQVEGCLCVDYDGPGQEQQP